jgi:hypothetical protein
LGVGFLLIGIGLFTIPHNANVAELISLALTSGVASHGTALTGLFLLISGGLFCGLGWIVRKKMPATENPDKLE